MPHRPSTRPDDNNVVTDRGRRHVLTAAQQPAEPLVPPSLRRPAALLAALGAGDALLLALRYRDDTRPGRIDGRLYDSIPSALRLHQGAAGALADVVPPLVAVLAVAVAGVAVARRRWNLAVLATAGPALSVLLTELAKRIDERTIRGGLAMPSGHTAAATSVLLVLALVALRRATRHPRLAAVGLWAGVTAGAAAVATAMVVIHAHYPTDTVAGYGLAVAVTLSTALAADAL